MLDWLDWLKSLAAGISRTMTERAGTSVEFVDPAPFLEAPPPEDTSQLGRMARESAAYNAEAAKNRAEAELAELKRVAKADLPSSEEIAEMSRRYGVSREALLAQFTQKKIEAQEALGKRQAAIEATKKEGVLLAQAVELARAVGERDLPALVKIGQNTADPGYQEARRVVADISPSFTSWD